jgi:hypothetical protein
MLRALTATGSRQAALYGPNRVRPMADRQQLLQKARSSRDLARRARDMSRFLSQRSDVDRISAYAHELEELADEMERRAGDRDSGHP